KNAVIGILIGFELFHKSFHVYNLETDRIIVTNSFNKRKDIDLSMYKLFSKCYIPTVTSSPVTFTSVDLILTVTTPVVNAPIGEDDSFLLDEDDFYSFDNPNADVISNPIVIHNDNVTDNADLISIDDFIPTEPVNESILNDSDISSGSNVDTTHPVTE